MENVDERLRLLEQTGCTLCGFTVNNATVEQFERFIALFAKAEDIEQLNLTELEDFSVMPDKYAGREELWQKRKERSLKYRQEHKIELKENTVLFFYEHILPKLIDLLLQKQKLQKLYLFNVTLTEAQKKQIQKIFDSHPVLKTAEFGNLSLLRTHNDKER